MIVRRARVRNEKPVNVPFRHQLTPDDDAVNKSVDLRVEVGNSVPATPSNTRKVLAISSPSRIRWPSGAKLRRYRLLIKQPRRTKGPS
mmetsp:Transcript_28080/g.77230  ORF Transcript_28080/g.77230 Transcript_28080/m.77230 type:complete len:88 (+) Transcript_28080:1333-1596(+)